MNDASTKDAQVSMRLSGELKQRIEAYARLTGRSKSFVAAEALTEYLDWRLPQMLDLDEAVAEADRGEFASDADVAAVFARHGVQYGQAATVAAATPAAVRTHGKRKRA